jgi:phosphate transport system protein
MPSPHTLHPFEAELEALHAEVATMTERCQRALGLALDGFRQRSPQPGPELSGLVDLVDADESTVDAHVLRVLALYQPVAGDLRMLLATFKLTTDLDRIAQDSLSIVRNASTPLLTEPAASAELDGMAACVKGMLRDAVRAFFERDPKLAQDVIERDRTVNLHYARMLEDIGAHLRTHPTDAGVSVPFFKVGRYVERIGDHAKNIAEEAIFASLGDDVRHRDPGHTG